MNLNYKDKELDYIDSFAYHIEQELKDRLDTYWDFKKNSYNPKNIYKKSQLKVWIKCKKHTYHGSYQISCAHFMKGVRCPYCFNKAINYFDSLGFRYFEIAKLIKSDDKGNKISIIDTYKIAPYTHKKFVFKCTKCGNEDTKRLDSVVSRGYSCTKCDDGKTIGEKFIFYLLKSKNINFISQLSKQNFEWCGNYRYDFYLPKYNTIIEINGYRNNKEKLFETNNVNLIKKNLAISNGISYKMINYYFNNKKSIERSTIEELKEILDLGNTDFEKIYNLSKESLIFIVCENWNNGKSILDISNELYTSKATVIKYLKIGAKIGLTNYNSKLEMKNNAINVNKKKSKKVICITTGEVFESQVKAAEKYNISTASIINCCKGRSKYGGKDKNNGEKLVWNYY